MQSSTSLMVSWQPPPAGTRNGIITGYKIRYKQRGGKRGETVTTDGNRRVYSLENLQKGTEYAVRISAMTVNGTGPATDWLVTETFTIDLDESEVPGIPESLHLRATDTSIQVNVMNIALQVHAGKCCQMNIAVQVSKDGLLAYR